MLQISSIPIVTIIALSVGMLFAATEMASAQKAKKLTYDQATRNAVAKLEPEPMRTRGPRGMSAVAPA